MERSRFELSNQFKLEKHFGENNMNCHFVTRSLTKEWEVSGGSLCYYDYSDKTVKRGFAKHLFSEEDTNSDEIEQLINKLVETPLLSLRPKMTSKGPISIDDWATYRSLFLYFMVQAARFSKAQLDDRTETDEEHKLDQLLKKDISYLDQLVSADMQDHQMVTLNMPEGQILFFPEGGFFQVPVAESISHLQRLSFCLAFHQNQSYKYWRGLHL